VNRPASDAGEERPLREGVTLRGRYRLEEQIGSGGISVVFRARDEELGETIAVKVLSKSTDDPVKDARLQRELMLSHRLAHPNTVRLFELGRSHGYRYLTMELLEGATLADRLPAGRIGLDEGLSYLVQACAALQAAHDLSVIHRDVKPANLFLVDDGPLKLMDFGIAKIRDAPGLTDVGYIAGTVAYMAPEQASDFRAVTSACDLYSLGVVAYEMFTGRRPFTFEDPFRVMRAHRDEAPRPPRQLVPALPEALEAVILRCLEKDPGRRFSSCRELAARLGEIRSGRA
jgi:serine/threonine-protein kinase